VVYEESTGTLLCGDLFTQLGDGPALTENDVVGPAIAAEDLFQYSCLSPNMGPTIRALAKLSPRTLALMHGPSFSGDGGAALSALADDYDRRTSDRRLTADQIKAA
jgi:hypothetical protein